MFTHKYHTACCISFVLQTYASHTLQLITKVVTHFFHHNKFCENNNILCKGITKAYGPQEQVNGKWAKISFRNISPINTFYKRFHSFIYFIYHSVFYWSNSFQSERRQITTKGIKNRSLQLGHSKKLQTKWQRSHYNLPIESSAEVLSCTFSSNVP